MDWSLCGSRRMTTFKKLPTMAPKKNAQQLKRIFASICTDSAGVERKDVNLHPSLFPYAGRWL